MSMSLCNDVSCTPIILIHRNGGFLFYMYSISLVIKTVFLVKQAGLLSAQFRHTHAAQPIPIGKYLGFQPAYRRKKLRLLL